MLLCISTDGRLWRSRFGGISQTKDAERRDKVERSLREGHAVSAGPVKAFRNAGDVKNAPLACERKATCEVRGQTRGFGPTHCQERWPTRSKGSRRAEKIADVS